MSFWDIVWMKKQQFFLRYFQAAVHMNITTKTYTMRKLPAPIDNQDLKEKKDTGYIIFPYIHNYYHMQDLGLVCIGWGIQPNAMLKKS